MSENSRLDAQIFHLVLGVELHHSQPHMFSITHEKAPTPHSWGTPGQRMHLLPEIWSRDSIFLLVAKSRRSFATLESCPETVGLDQRVLLE